MWQCAIAIGVWVLVGTQGGAPAPSQPNKLPLSAVIQRATLADRPLVVAFHARRCPACRKFELQVLGSPRVKRALTQVEFVRYSVNTPLGRQAGAWFGVNHTGVTLVFANPSGTAFRRIADVGDEAWFLAMLKQASVDRIDEGSIQHSLVEFPADPEVLLRAAQWYLGRGNRTAALALYDRLIRSASTPRDPRVGQARRERAALVRYRAARVARAQRAMSDIRADPGAHGALTALTVVVESRAIAQADIDTLAASIEAQLSGDLGEVERAIYRFLDAGSYQVARRAAQRFAALSPAPKTKLMADKAIASFDAWRARVRNDPSLPRPALPHARWLRANAVRILAQLPGADPTTLLAWPGDGRMRRVSSTSARPASPANPRERELTSEAARAAHDPARLGRSRGVVHTALADVAPMRFIGLTAGEFVMGSEPSPGVPASQTPQHRVRLSPFAVATSEVTETQWDAVMGVRGPNRNSCIRQRSERCSTSLPVRNITWHEAIEFLNRLSRREGLTPCYSMRDTDVMWDRACDGYRLPTEAEWEYAARAGAMTRYSFGDDRQQLAEHAWYVDNSGGAPQPVMTRRPNRWGVHDMLGNVSEWTWDPFGSYPLYPRSHEGDPTGPEFGMQRTVRGGHSSAGETAQWSAQRVGAPPESATAFVGLRCARGAIKP